MSIAQHASPNIPETASQPTTRTTSVITMGSHESKIEPKGPNFSSVDSTNTKELTSVINSQHEISHSKLHLSKTVVGKGIFINSSYANRNTNNDEDSANESFPQTEEILEEPHDRSDGSDSGLGSEISEERRIDNAIATPLASDNENSLLESIDTEPKFSTEEQANIEAVPSTTNTHNRVIDMDRKPGRSSLKRKASDSQDNNRPKCKKKRGITFDNVTVFYFPRTQGFTCVPSQGGSTLGMGSKHSYMRKFSIVEHANEQRRVHRQILQRIHAERQNVPNTTSSSSEDSESEEEVSDASDSEIDLENYYFLQPVPTRQRRALLRSAGIRKIDSIEKDECRDIRSSREFCGCGCKGYCDPDTCSCSQAGIKCQVDRLNFPCGCSRENCGNLSGRIEFNPMRVRTHFIHTLMRIQLEKKQSEAELQNERIPGAHWAGSNRLSFSNSEGKFTGGLLKDVPLNSNIEVESCVHNGNFTNLHYGAPGEGPGIMSHPNQSFSNLQGREDSLDLYTFREDCYQEVVAHNGMPEDRKFSHRPFSPNQSFHIPDGHFPHNSFQEGASSYPTTSNQYSLAYHSNFGDFSPVFNPYGNIYGSEFDTKPFDDDFQQSSGYEQYPANETDNYTISDLKDSQYTSLNPVGVNNKIESFSDLLNGRYTYGAYEDSTGFSSINTSDVCFNNDEKLNCTATNASQDSDDCEENFGEIIKKSIVETVSA